MLKVVDDQEANAFVDMIELRGEVTVSDFVELCAELRINTIDIPFVEAIYRVGISGGWLRISMEGLRAITGMRPGDINPLKTNIAHDTSAVRKIVGSTTITAMIGGKIGIKTDAELNGQLTSEASQSTSFTHSGLRALPNNSWRIENPKGADVPIQSSVLTGERLLSLRKKDAANRFMIDLAVDVAPSEITVSSKTRKRRIRQVNRERVIQLIALRAINEKVNGKLEAGAPLRISKTTFLLGESDD